MSSVTNLNRFRKQKARAEKKVRADQNAILHGLPKSARNLAKRTKSHEEAQHSGLRLTVSDPDGDIV